MKSITVVGRRWRDKVNGNTYHTSQIMIDGETVHKTPLQYGYDNHYLQTASEWLEKSGFITLEVYPNGCHESIWRYCGEQDIHLEYWAEDLPCKKDC